MHGIVIAGTHSGCGKTTITLGLLAALRRKGLRVQSFKTGPDFIDSGLHRLVTGQPSRNLDLWMCGEAYVRESFNRHSISADISVIEGVMGLYDGQHNGKFSTAALAEALGLPVILVVDAYGMAESAGAVVKGFRDWSLGIAQENTNPRPLTPNPFICGVIFNRVGSENHYKRLKDSIQGVPILGCLPKNLDFEIPHRHLGLTVAEEKPISEENIQKLAETVLKHIDIEKILRSAKCEMRSDYKIDYKPEIPALNLMPHTSQSCKIAVAFDKAFCFYYEDNFELLREAGAKIQTFSPVHDSSIPDGTEALYIGGGYPELYAEELSGNQAMLSSIKAWAEAGKPVYAECGGLMFLSQGIYDFDGRFFRMAGVLPFETVMSRSKSKIGYREILLKEDCILGRHGERLRGHEFHYSEIKNSQHAAASKQPLTGYSVRDGQGKDIGIEGYRIKNTLASYIHIHFGSNNDAAKGFVAFAGIRFA